MPVWRQVLISNKKPVMRSLFPHIQIDVKCGATSRETGVAGKTHATHSRHIHAHMQKHTHRYTLASTFLVTDLNTHPVK